MLNEVLSIRVSDFLIISGVIFAFCVLKIVANGVNNATGNKKSNPVRTVRDNHVKGVPIKKINTVDDDFDEFMEWDLMGEDDDDIDGMWD